MASRNNSKAGDRGGSRVFASVGYDPPFNARSAIAPVVLVESPCLGPKRRRPARHSQWVSQSRLYGFAKVLLGDQAGSFLRESANQYEFVEDVIFANTFFALEETGLPRPTPQSEKYYTIKCWDRTDWPHAPSRLFREIKNTFVGAREQARLGIEETDSCYSIFPFCYAYPM
jgi:hypothetical protein